MRANYQVNLTPQFRVLSDPQIEEIVAAAQEVLSRVGTRVYHDEALALLRGAGCSVSDGSLVRIPAWLVKEALSTAPSRIVVRGRDRRKAIALEKDKIYFGTGSDCPSLVDPYSGEVRKYTFQDVYNAARISDALPNIDFHMSLGLTGGVPAATYDRHQFLAMLKGTSKPLVITANDREGLADQYRMACEVLGGEEEFAQMPLFVVYNEPVSPLSHSVEAVDKLLYAAKKAIPAMYTPGTTCGATAPATLAGGMVQGLAEYFAGLVLTQLKRRGAPLIMGGVTTVMDMATSQFTYGSPELVLISAAMTDVAKWLGLPMFSTAGCSDSKVLDQQAAIESAVSVTIAALSGANLIHDVGYLESGKLGSYDMLVMSNEVIAMVKHIMGGVAVTPETMAVDVIEQVGPGGHYLAQEHTRRSFRSQMWFPALMDRQMRRAWEAGGGLTMAERVRAKVRSILESHQPMPVPADVEARLVEIVAEADRRHSR
jgi:trimethylamine---corrinoid protein Co-methyltransferase